MSLISPSKGVNPGSIKNLPEDAPIMATASSAPNIVDPRTGAARRAASTDIKILAIMHFKCIIAKLSSTPRSAMASTIKKFGSDLGDKVRPGYT